MTVLEELREDLDDLGCGVAFLDSTPKSRCMQRPDQLDVIITRHVCFVKDTAKRMGRQATDWEKSISKDILITESYTQYSKNSKNSAMRK